MNKNILKNKKCLITGATGGIGKEVAKLLYSNGCHIFLTSRNQKNLEKLKTELKNVKNNKNQVSYESGDLTKTEDINRIIKKVRKNFKEIDILVNCAGIFFIEPLSTSKLKDFENCLKISVIAPFIFSKEFSQEMTKKKWGRIINIGSSSSYNGFKNGSIYCSAKHSILGLSRALQHELKEKNVRVLCISPDSTQTNMGKLSTDQDFNTFLNPKEVAEYIIFSMLFDKEMIIDESRLNRMILK